MIFFLKIRPRWLKMRKIRKLPGHIRLFVQSQRERILSRRVSQFHHHFLISAYRTQTHPSIIKTTCGRTYQVLRIPFCGQIEKRWNAVF